MRGLFSGICRSIFENDKWFINQIFHSIQHKNPEISIILTNNGWSKVLPSLTDNSDDHQDHFLLWESLTLVSVYRFSIIINDSWTTSFPLFGKKRRNFYDLLSRNCGWSNVHLFLRDNSNDHHNHFFLWQGFFQESVDQFLNIINDS